MNAPNYSASDLAAIFGDNYSPSGGVSAGALIPINALHSFSEELGVLSLAANEDHTDFEIVLIRMARRMGVAAELGHTEILAMAARIEELEAQLAAKKGDGAQ